MKNLIIILSLCLIIGCTENTRAKSFGGSATINLPPGQKLFDVTWKEANLWYCTRPMRENEQAEEYTFQEKSSFGIIEGTVTFVESK